MLLANPLPATELYPNDEASGNGKNLTVGIAAYNEAANIGHLIERIQSDIGPTDQIIVVSSGSTDSTSDIVLHYSKSDPRVRLIKEGRREGKSSAINKILSASVGKMIFLVSADVLPSTGCIPKMVSAMQSDSAVGIVSSRPYPVNGTHNFTGYLGHLYWRLHHETLSLLDASNQNTHGGEAILLRQGVVSSIPDDCINDDAYIGVEAAKRGYIVRYCPQAMVMTKTPVTITELIAQRRRIMAGHMKIRKHTGLYPSVLTTMTFKDPSKFVKIVSKELRSHPRSFPRFLVATYIDAASTFLAILDRMFGRDNLLWRTAISTKVLER